MRHLKHLALMFVVGSLRQWKQSRFTWLVASFALVSCGAIGQEGRPVDAGKAALERRDYRSAEAFYKKALLQYPASSELLTNLGIAIQSQGRSAEAIHIFSEALKSGRLPRTYALLAEEKCKTRDLEGARPMLAKILKEDASDLQLLAQVAPCYLELDEPMEAVAVYSALLSDASFPRDLARLQLAKSYLLSTQFFITRLSAAAGSSRYMTAIREARDQASPDARGAFKEAARSSPYFNASLSFPEAVRSWRRHPGDTTLLYLLSVLSGEESMHQVQICEDKYPNSPYLEQLRVEMLADQGHTEEAIRGYERILQSYPELPDVRYNLGMLYRKCRLWEMALEVFRQQVVQDPQDERSAARMSEALVKLTRWGDIRDFLEPLVEKNEPPLWAVLDLSQALQNLNETQRAIHFLETAEKGNVANQAIHFRLLLLYRKNGDAVRLQAEDRWLRTNPR